MRKNLIENSQHQGKPAEPEYLSPAQTAALIRQALKRGYPGVKFSVRTRVYSMGASVDVSWTDGPTTRDVDAIVCRYQGAEFDGMIDLKTHREHFLTPDGIAVMAHTAGSEGSMGTIERVDNPAPPFEVRRVRFGADYVNCSRHLSPAFSQKLTAVWRALTVDEWKAICAKLGTRNDEPDDPARGAWLLSTITAG